LISRRLFTRFSKKYASKSARGVDFFMSNPIIVACQCSNLILYDIALAHMILADSGRTNLPRSPEVSFSSDKYYFDLGFFCTFRSRLKLSMFLVGTGYCDVYWIDSRKRLEERSIQRSGGERSDLRNARRFQTLKFSTFSTCQWTHCSMICMHKRLGTIASDLTPKGPYGPGTSILL